MFSFLNRRKRLLGACEPKTEDRPKYCFHAWNDGEFRGDTAEEIIGLLYEVSRSGIPGLTFDEWWRYQNRMWRRFFPLDLPEEGDEKKFEKLLVSMVKGRGLQVGPYREMPPVRGKR